MRKRSRSSDSDRRRVRIKGSRLASSRVDVPIRQSALPNGAIRYTLSLTVGGCPIDAMFDTGSMGLRLLPGAVEPTALEIQPIDSVYGYASGVRLLGSFALADVVLSDCKGARGRIYVQSVQSLDCIPQKPNCPAPQIRDAGFLIFGDGFPGRGYRAVFGAGLRPSGVPNPLTVIGDGVWIVTLPLPGAREPGCLLLNPTAKDKEGFTYFQLQTQSVTTPLGDVTGWNDALPGCLIDIASGRSIETPIAFDSGAPFFTVISNDISHLNPWLAGTRAELRVGDVALRLRTPFTVQTDPGGVVYTARPHGGQWEGIRAGTIPYYAFSVLYDSKQGKIGLRAREGGARSRRKRIFNSQR